MARGSDTAIAGTQSGHIPLAELPMANTSDTAIAGTQSGHIPLAELPMANTSDTAIAGTQSGQVVWAEQAPPAVYTSGFSGGFTGSATSWANVPGCVITGAVLSGKPLMMMGLSDGENYPQYVGLYSSTYYDGSRSVVFRILVTGTNNYTFPLGMVQMASRAETDTPTYGTLYVPPGSLSYLFTPLAGTYTFQLQYQVDSSSTVAAALNVGFTIYEL
jgi:hypothetical protein